MLRSVDCLSDSEPEEVTPQAGVQLKPVDEVSSADSAGPDEGPVLPVSGKKKLKRKRTSTDLPPMRERLSNSTFLKNLLSKACKKCTKNCLSKFAKSPQLDELKKFRDHWVSLAKGDQDRLVFQLSFRIELSNCFHFGLQAL